MEKDDEIKDEGNSYTTYFRQYDPRLGRWKSIDPKTVFFPNQSPYISMDGNPIALNDPNGDCTDGDCPAVGDFKDENTGEIYTYDESNEGDDAITVDMLAEAGLIPNWEETYSDLVENIPYKTARLAKRYELEIKLEGILVQEHNLDNR